MKKTNDIRDEWKNDLNDLAKEDRHSLKNTVAACRLFQGYAITCDLLDVEKFHKVFRQLGKKGALRNKSFGEKFIAKLEITRKIREASFQGRNNPRIDTKDRKLLLIDDMVEDAGWKIVFDAIFGNKNVIYADSVAKGRLLAESNKDELFVVFIDLNFNDEKTMGLELVKEFHEKYEFLPLIIFSALDSVVYLKSGLKLGAWDYFAKELGDDLYHNPVDYYNEFHNIIGRILAYDAMYYSTYFPTIKRYTDFLSNMEFEQGAPLRKELIFHLKKAYYFITKDNTDRYSVTTGTMNQFSEAVFQMALALEVFVTLLIMEKRITVPVIADDNQILRLEKKDQSGTTLGSRINYLKNNQENHSLSREWFKAAFRLNELRASIAHSSGREIRPDTAKHQMAEALTLVNPIHIYEQE